MNKLLVTWDTVNKGSGVALSENNMTALVPNMSNTVRASVGRDSGKWYWEIEIISTNTSMIGIVNELANLNASNYSSQNSRYYYVDGKKYPEASPYGLIYGTGDCIGVALDLDLGTLEFFKNGVSQKISHTNIKNMGKVFPAITDGSSSNSTTKYRANFGEREFKHPIPNGFKDYGNYPISKMLLQSNNKTYSLVDMTTWYETKMTSNTLPTPLVASASGEYDNNYKAYKAFNGTNGGSSDCWVTSRGSIDGYLQIDFYNPICHNMIKLTSRNDSNTNVSPKDFTIVASNDGDVFEELTKITGQKNWLSNESRLFTFRNTKKYRFYKMIITSNNGYTDYSAVGQLQFGYAGNYLTESHKISTDNFLKYGMKNGFNIKGMISRKNYVLQDTVSENLNGLWTTQLDRKPLSIKFE